MSTSVLWLFSAGVGIFFPWIKNTYSIEMAFIIFFIFTLIGLIFMIFVLTETKNKTQK